MDATSTGTRVLEKTSGDTSLSDDVKFYIKALLLGLAAISAWRGVWLLSDLYIFPNDLTVSGIVSVAIGLVIFVLYREIRL